MISLIPIEKNTRRQFLLASKGKISCKIIIDGKSPSLQRAENEMV
jgi:hypothetical protein